MCEFCPLVGDSCCVCNRGQLVTLTLAPIDNEYRVLSLPDVAPVGRSAVWVVWLEVLAMAVVVGVVFAIAAALFGGTT